MSAPPNPSGYLATNPTTWTAPGIETRLCDLWLVDRRSAGAIAATLSREFGVPVSRSAVLGKLKRMELLGCGGIRSFLAVRDAA